MASPPEGHPARAGVLQLHAIMEQFKSGDAEAGLNMINMASLQENCDDAIQVRASLAFLRCHLPCNLHSSCACQSINDAIMLHAA